MIDTVSKLQLEFIVGSDRILRVNSDGICVFRTRCLPDCEVKISLPASLVTTQDGAYVFK